MLWWKHISWATPPKQTEIGKKRGIKEKNSHFEAVMILKNECFDAIINSYNTINDIFFLTSLLQKNQTTLNLYTLYSKAHYSQVTTKAAYVYKVWRREKDIKKGRKFKHCLQEGCEGTIVSRHTVFQKLGMSFVIHQISLEPWREVPVLSPNWRVHSFRDRLIAHRSRRHHPLCNWTKKHNVFSCSAVANTKASAPIMMAAGLCRMGRKKEEGREERSRRRRALLCKFHILHQISLSRLTSKTGINQNRASPFG
jgi:hypothetical protein